MKRIEPGYVGMAVILALVLFGLWAAGRTVANNPGSGPRCAAMVAAGIACPELLEQGYEDGRRLGGEQ